MTFNKDRVIPFCSCIYRLSKSCAKHNRDLTENEYQICLKDCVVFKGIDCTNDILHQVLTFKRENKKVNIKIVECYLYVIALTGCGVSGFVVLNNLPQCRSVVNF